MTDTERVDVAVVGAGVVGLAAALALARAGREVVVLESERSIGSHTSSRNSEVIHAGIYYPENSLKARLCIQGKRAIYQFCAEHAVPHRRIGKLIVAVGVAELPVLAALKARAERNGVHDLIALTGDEVRALEPSVHAVAGLFSPGTGILDSASYLAALRRELEARGGEIVLASPVLGGAVLDHGIELSLGGNTPWRVKCRSVVNAAGLWAPQVARTIVGVPEQGIPSAYYAKGHYFVLNAPSPFKHLIYPVPVPGALGTHVTLDLAGRARFGPDVSWVEGVDYSFDGDRVGGFYASVRRYYPGLPDGVLMPGYTGIRPKLGPQGTPNADFIVQGPRDHGVPSLVNLFGIESPGLTASLALGNAVAELLR